MEYTGWIVREGRGHKSSMNPWGWMGGFLVTAREHLDITRQKTLLLGLVDKAAGVLYPLILCKLGM